jgi:putative tricarboxylic transport membrane protein
MIKHYKDFWSGLMFMAFGLTVISIARDYPFGNSVRMGPGFFPMVLASLLAVIGLIVTVRACFDRRHVSVGPLAWKPLLIILAATALYGLLVRDAGFIAVTFACVLITARASKRGRLIPQVLLAAGTTLCCMLIFIHGLGVPLTLFGSLFGR